MKTHLVFNLDGLVWPQKTETILSLGSNPRGNWKETLGMDSEKCKENDQIPAKLHSVVAEINHFGWVGETA